jgi:predicted RNA-binding protein YlxR (DUF448 family)
MSVKGHIPIRTCVGCRKKRKKEEMIWLVQRPEGTVVVDTKKPHRGRGLYVCPDRECLSMARKRNRKGFFIQEVGNGKE